MDPDLPTSILTPPEPTKRIHQTLSHSYIADISLSAIYPCVKSTPLNFLSKQVIPYYRENYLLARINNEVFIHPDKSKIDINLTRDTQNITSVLFNSAIKSITPIPNTSNVLVGKANSQPMVLDLENARARAVTSETTSSDQLYSYSTPLNEDTMMFHYDKHCSSIVRLTDPSSYDNISYTLVQKVSLPLFTRTKLLNPLCLVGNMSLVQNTNNLCFTNTVTFQNERELKIPGAIYCVSCHNHNTLAIGGDQQSLLFFDIRVQKKIWSIRVKERWVGDICFLDETRMLYSDWNKLIDYDIRMGEMDTHHNNKSGIWGIYTLSDERIATISSDPVTHFYTTT